MTLLVEKLAHDALMEPIYARANKQADRDANKDGKSVREAVFTAVAVALAVHVGDEAARDLADGMCVTLSDHLEETHRPIALGVLGSDVEG